MEYPNTTTLDRPRMSEEQLRLNIGELCRTAINDGVSTVDVAHALREFALRYNPDLGEDLGPTY